MNFKVAYLANGQLHLKSGDSAAQPVESEFGESLRNSRRQIQRRNAWKKNPLAQMVFQEAESNDLETKQPITLTGICNGVAGQLFYALSTVGMGGILALDVDRQKENRLFHSADFSVHDLSYLAEQDLLACSLRHPSGEANIATMKADGIRPAEITEGDSLDLAPAWIPGQKKALVFQSAGIARSGEGVLMAQGPFAIEKLDFEAGTVDTLVSDPNYDFLAPQMLADGRLYYIRRPYRKIPTPSFWNLLKRVLVMPFLLAYAVFQWLNLFTLRYTGKPMIKQPDRPKATGIGQAVLHGQAVDTNQEAERNQKFEDEDSPALVPRNWELVCQAGDGEVQTIARGVVAFHVGQDGSVVYTNGGAIYGIVPGGVANRILKEKGRLIEQVKLLV
ncbi:MAG: hypothetical protein HC860_16705 [Alkalinema sp. RU_4_3]|nr:hypothetical protein [Alkalinema sp. RU_4_3]